MHEAERGLFDLLRGRVLCVSGSPVAAAAEETVLMASVEALNDDTLATLRRHVGPLRLAVTGHRARAMGLASGEHRVSNMSLRLNADASAEDIYRLSTVSGNYAAVAVGLREASACEAGGLALTRLGRVLPAVVSVAVAEQERPAVRESVTSGLILAVTTDQIEAMVANERLAVTHVSEGPVPLAEAEDARFVSFREANGILEHVAVLVGDRDQWPDPLPVRIHSACLTGDLFGSLRCDCGEQLRGSLRVFAARGGGVLLYLDQEGRGIGFGNKLRAYALQHEGLDTVDADCTLGFGADERRYDAAVAMLRHLDVDRIQLLTNNPEKVRAMRAGGIRVIDRQPLYGTLNRHNLRYVKAKVQRAGHWLGDMLSGAVPGK